jgi:Ca-activated chloride channel family protein
MIHRPGTLLVSCLAAAAASGHAGAQRAADPLSALGRASHVVVPQIRSLSLTSHSPCVEVEAVQAHVEILERTARTTLQVLLRSSSSRQEEAVVLVPVSGGAAVTAFSFEGAGAEPQVQVLAAGEARRLYDAIVAKARDPALLEFAGLNVVRSSVFPVPPQGTQKVRLSWEEILSADGDRLDYVLPRSESLEGRLPWDVTVELRSARPVSTVYSPSHALLTDRRGPGDLVVRLTHEARLEPGPFRLSWLLGGEGVSATLLAYPDPEVQGGYFLLLAGLPVRIDQAAPPVKREVTIVIDRSGSMAGSKLDQARAAALQIVEGLQEGEAFNILDYAHTVSSFAPRAVLRDAQTVLQARRYLESLRPSGGTNIHDALLEALRQESAGPDHLPIVLFLTDGIPTIGRTAEADIRRMVEAGNGTQRRVFTFGVGADVNAPLLDAIAVATRGISTYVLPGQDIELTVAGVFRRLYGPVLAEPSLQTLGPDGEISTRLVRELIPTPLPDLFEGDQLVLLGQYRTGGPITFRLGGRFLGARRSFEFTFPLRDATTRNGFVPRLWASRRIGELVDRIRQDPSCPPGSSTQRELVEEILRLSRRFGVLTEYTAFLANEGTDLGDLAALVGGCGAELSAKAVAPRWGAAAVKTALNINRQKGQACLKHANTYLDDRFQGIEVAGIQQVADLAFFRRGEAWVDSRLLSKPGSIALDAEVAPGSAAHEALLRRLCDEGRQAALALRGSILIEVDGKTLLVRDIR